MTHTRRSLLATGAGLVAATALGPQSPALAGSWRERRQPRVVIVGAGLAGLACADTLRRRGLHADVYEARPDRIGGRCWSSRGWQDGQVAEHGGEFIDTRHTRMRALAKRFGLGLDDTYDTTGVPRLLLNGRRRFRWQFAEETRLFNRRIIRLAESIGRYDSIHPTALAKQVDEMTALEVVDHYMPGGSSSAAGRAYHCFLVGYLGLSLADLGGLAVVDDRASDIRGADERYHVQGGNDQIVHGLARQLRRGSITQDAPLTAVAERADGSFILQFGHSSKRVIADAVVFCLPFTALRQCDLDGAGLSNRKRRCINELGMGSNAKVILQFDDRPQDFNGWNGFLTTDRPILQTWESSAGQPGQAGLLTVYYGGRSGAEGLPAGVSHAPAPHRLVDEVLRDLTRGGRSDLPGLRGSYLGKAHLDHWTEDRWVRGSYAAYLPGQYTRFAGFVGRPEGNLFFAGEHTSPLSNQGYLEGAVRTGERAAREVLASIG